jgi:uncharacterized protein (TIGR02646 family)
MIHIDRGRLDQNGRPILPSPEWFHLAQMATALAIVEQSTHTFKGSVYGHDSVRAALEALFHRKCAYCETTLPQRVWPVEHFRPKGRVAERPDHPGYYWLAYEWANLYASCTACNQILRDTPTWEDPVEGEAEGKGDKFPIADESKRAMSHDVGEIELEEPLLLDPCKDQPEGRLLYDGFGEIEAAPGDVKAQTSIEILHLKRKRLRDARRNRIKQAISALRLIRAYEGGELPTVTEEEIGEIKIDFFADSSPYAGATRFVRNDPDAFGV